MTVYYPGTKVCISGKSPQSNGLIGSTVTGEFGVDLECAGYDGIIIGEGGEALLPLRMRQPYRDQGCFPRLGKDGEGNPALPREKKSREDISSIRPRYGEAKEPSILYIGPAGESKSRVAAVTSKYSYAAGYGGDDNLPRFERERRRARPRFCLAKHSALEARQRLPEFLVQMQESA